MADGTQTAETARTAHAALPPLGVAAVLNDSLEQYAAAFVPLTAAVLVPDAIGSALTGAVFGARTVLMADYGAWGVAATLTHYLIAGAVGGIAVVLMVHGPDRDTGGRTHTAPPGLLAAWGGALVLLPRAALVSAAMTVALLLGFALAVIPAFWVLGLLAVAIPAVAVERRGWDALARSAALTKGYRWPVALVSSILFLPLVVAGFLFEQLLFRMVLRWEPWAALMLEPLVYAAPATLSIVFAARLYRRLRALCDAPADAEIAAVFA
ncbi:MAG: hypothetical protein AAF677_02500 [Pseudomonadota bacterium]